MRSSAIAEGIGIRTVSIICTGFLESARSLSEMHGFPEMIVVEYPGHVSIDDDPTFYDKVRTLLAPNAVQGLLGL